MATKHVRSDDPRKRAIVEALKARSGCRKVTTVKHDTTRQVFTGSCIWPGSETAEPGVYEVSPAEIGLEADGSIPEASA